VQLERFVGPAIHAHGHGEVAIHEGVFDDRLAVPAHVHDEAVVSLMLSGVATERVAEGTRTIAAQDLIFTPAHASHSYEFRQAGRWLNMQISDAWLAKATDGNRLLYERSEIVKSPAAAAWATRVRSEVRSPDSASKQTFGETSGQYARAVRGR
jgi:quercetin dioxygenase-like cupin family protein